MSVEEVLFLVRMVNNVYLQQLESSRIPSYYWCTSEMSLNGL